MGSPMVRIAAMHLGARLRQLTRLGVVPLGLGLGCEPGELAPTAAPADATGLSAPRDPTTLQINDARMFADLAHLASNDLQGRYTMAPELRAAAQFIVKKHKQAGIDPVGAGYLVPFPLITGARTSGDQRLEVRKRSKAVAVAADAFTPVANSGSGAVEGDLVFVGYAAQSEPRDDDKGDTNAPTARADDAREYDDLAGLVLEGKVALVLMDAPGTPSYRTLLRALREEGESFGTRATQLRENKDEKGMSKLHAEIRARVGTLLEPFLRGEKLDKEFYAPPENPLEADFNLMELLGPVMATTRKLPGPHFGRRSSSLARKVRRLQRAGAVGVIAVRGARSFITSEDRAEDALADLANSGVSRGNDLGMPVVQLGWKEADKLFKVRGKKLSQLQKTIDTKLEPQSGETGASVKLSAWVTPITQDVPNVLGMIEGTDLKHEIVLLGAHYDHIGNADNGRCDTVRDDAGNEDSICNGADDNASGSAMVLELGRAMKEAGFKPRRTLVFAHFAGEELGLHGSAALAQNPPEAGPFEGGQVVAMVNLDMVGRLGPKGLAIGGLSSSDQWMPMLDEIGNHGMKILYERSIASRSDQANFYRQEIPVLFFFTNVHRDYHRATDHIDKIDRDGMLKIASIVGEVMVRLGQGAPINYTAPRTPEEGLNRALPGETPSTVEKRVNSDGTEV